MKINKISIQNQFNEDEILNIKGGFALGHNIQEAGCTCDCWFSN